MRRVQTAEEEEQAKNGGRMRGVGTVGQGLQKPRASAGREAVEGLGLTSGKGIWRWAAGDS